MQHCSFVAAYLKTSTAKRACFALILPCYYRLYSRYRVTVFCSRLQRVQNTAARLVLDVPHSSRSQPLYTYRTALAAYREPHQVQTVCFNVYRVSHGTAPLYLCELCKPCTDSRLRSKSRGDFSTPPTRLRFTDKAFAVSAPSAWNSLPIIDIRDCSSEATFKKHLKTFLFIVAFN